MCIILDVMLPGKDGWQILQSYKSHPATADIPVLICSVLEMEEPGEFPGRGWISQEAAGSRRALVDSEPVGGVKVSSFGGPWLEID